MIKDVTDYQLSLMSPKSFDPESSANYIKKIEITFENLCASLEELGVIRPNELTVFQFYSKIRYFKEKKSNRAAK